MHRSRLRALPVSLGLVLLGACGDTTSAQQGSATPSASGSGVVAGDIPAEARPQKRAATEREAGVMMRSVDGKRVYVADEDNRVVRVLKLPFLEPVRPAEGAASPTPSPSASASASAPPPKPVHPHQQSLIEPAPPPPHVDHDEVALPGPPANLLPLDGRLLVTIRDPGMLLVLSERADGGLVEESRIELPADAWGLAVTKDESTAIVTSAWTHRATGIDLLTMKQTWSLEVAREPRGVAIHPSTQVAYITHLTGSTSRASTA